MSTGVGPFAALVTFAVRPPAAAGPGRLADARPRSIGAAALMAVALTLSGCATTPPATPPAAPPAAGSGNGDSGVRVQPEGRRGGYYLDDGPGERTPQEVEALAALPDPVPVPEPLHPRANRPYRVLGNDYQPMTQRRPFMQQGSASWYGKKFHGQLTSTGERYDMYGMTAAHPTLPLPSFARVTNLDNGRSVVVRINDRGPFLHGRAIDLSFLAAHKLGYVQNGSARVQVELLDPSTTLGSGNAARQVVNTSHAVQAAPPVVPAPVVTNASAPASEAHYLQLGAYESAANAEAASANLRARLEWLQVPIEVMPAGGLYRVQAGPYPLREQAARAGAEVASRTGLRPLLLPR